MRRLLQKQIVKTMTPIRNMIRSTPIACLCSQLEQHNPNLTIQNSPTSEKQLTYIQVLKQQDLERTRNIGIIAHVDHGKTTLVDCLLQQSGCKVSQERMMDSNELEQERGITILSKCTTLTHQNHKLNVMDTPGHSDFGGEVERVMGMIDGVCLVVCATEGVMTQTKFVLQKALNQGLKVIVVINKVDRDTARVDEVENDIFGLFCELEADDSVLDYPVFYASAKNGWAVQKKPDQEYFNLAKIEQQSTVCILDEVIRYINKPKVDQQLQDLTMLVTQIEHDSYFGKMLIGKVQSGSINLKDSIVAVDQNGELIDHGSVQKIITKYGHEKVELESAIAGDIVSISGLSQKAGITHTINKVGNNHVVKSIEIDPPMISIDISVNTSPIAGQEGTKISKQDILQRLMFESDTDVSLKVNVGEDNKINIQGRGDLHLGILIERMRREGFEMSIFPPTVIFKQEGKKKLEPIEKVEVEVDGDYANKIIEAIQNRKGSYEDCINLSPQVQKLVFTIPTRALLGLRSQLIRETSGTAVMQQTFLGYEEYKGILQKNPKGALISNTQGNANSYGIQQIEKFGTMFVKNQSKVYMGMVIGEHIKDGDIDLNPTKEKKITNVRSTGADEKIVLTQPRQFTLEEAIAYVRDDELIEVTPNDIRIRKLILDATQRKVINRKSKK